MTAKVSLAVVLLLLAVFGAVAVVEASGKPRESIARRVIEAGKERLEPDGKLCVACTLGLTIAENEARKEEKPISQMLAKACKLLPSSVSGICTMIVDSFTPILIEKLLDKYDPDTVCSTHLKVCKECRIDNQPTGSAFAPAGFHQQLVARALSSLMQFQLTWPRTKEGSSAFGSNVLPTLDNDGDFFSPSHKITRGADWRGEDCDDHNKAVHPGVYDTTEADWNCNGIYGSSPDTGFTFEQMWCAQSQSRSLAFFGDSASAGFEISSEWLNLDNLTLLGQALLDELDWPMKAWGSGWDISVGNLSIYRGMVDNNRCNRGDFQSMAKNGAEIRDLGQYQVSDFDCAPTNKPVSAIIGYIGNDVCHDNLQDMTTPAEFRTRLLDGLTQLDKKVPKGSFVVLLGLVDGRILFNTLHNQIHPLGVTYEQFYDFLDCTNSNPCRTWLTSDEVSRNATSARAAELDAVIEDVVKNGQFSNFKLGFMDFTELVEDGFEIIERQGIPRKFLISAMDGFHPSIGVGHRVIADVLWTHIKEKFPEFVGPFNPHNNDIRGKFGNQ